MTSCHAHNAAREYDNVIARCPNCHGRADKGESDRKALRLDRLNLHFLHGEYSQVEMDVLFGLVKLLDGEFERWPAFNRILLRRIEELGFIAVREMVGGIITGGMRVVTRRNFAYTQSSRIRGGAWPKRILTRGCLSRGRSPQKITFAETRDMGVRGKRGADVSAEFQLERDNCREDGLSLSNALR